MPRPPKLRNLFDAMLPHWRPPDINFVARQDNLHTIRQFLPDWAPDLPVRIFSYETLPPPETLPPGLWIFADVERLTPQTLPIAMTAWERLRARYGRRVRLLNRPGASLSRRQLLNRLRHTGRNQFAVHEVADWQKITRFPVFVRLANEHFGAQTPLLADAQALQAGIATVQSRGYAPEDMLVVEFLDTSVDGIYRKFSVFRAGELFLAQHVFHSTDWHVKASALNDDAGSIAEDRAYRETNPHLKAVEEIFDLAGIDYGRIDYGMLNGRVQTWEINSNPTIMYPPGHYTAAQLPAKLKFASTLKNQFRELVWSTRR